MMRWRYSAPADGLHLVAAFQLAAHQQAVDPFAPVLLKQGDDGVKDHLVLGVVERVALERLDDVADAPGVHDHRAEHGRLGPQVLGHAATVDGLEESPLVLRTNCPRSRRIHRLLALSFYHCRPRNQPSDSTLSILNSADRRAFYRMKRSSSIFAYLGKKIGDERPISVRPAWQVARTSTVRPVVDVVARHGTMGDRRGQTVACGRPP